MAMQKEMAELEQQAESNPNEDKSKIELSEKDLEKVPKETFDKLEKVKGKPGYRNVHLKHTELALVAKFIENEEARKKIDFAVGNINKDKNVPLIEKLTQLRQDMAVLMGYQSFTELTLKDQMAKDAANVEELLDDLSGRITEKGKKEKLKLTEYKRKSTGNRKAEFENWDLAFYGARYKKQFFHIEEDIIKEYFPAEHVKEATMDIYQELLGLDFRKLPNAQTWHEEVSCYEVKDKKSH